MIVRCRKEGEMLTIVYLVITLGSLTWGAVTDYKTRQISNVVPVLLIIAGFFSGVPFPYKIIGLLAPLLSYFIIDKVRKRNSSGGDVKLISALGFNLGLPSLCVVLILTSLIALIVVKSIKKTVPLCTYMVAGYGLFVSSLLIGSLL